MILFLIFFIIISTPPPIYIVHCTASLPLTRIPFPCHVPHHLLSLPSPLPCIPTHCHVSFAIICSISLPQAFYIPTPCYVFLSPRHVFLPQATCPSSMLWLPSSWYTVSPFTCMLLSMICLTPRCYIVSLPHAMSSSHMQCIPFPYHAICAAPPPLDFCVRV